MPKNSVYSFNDVSLDLTYHSQPKKNNDWPKGSKMEKTLTGEGCDTLVIARANDQSQQDIAADGSVMTSKIVTHNDTLSITLQQTSKANDFLLEWYKTVISGDLSLWTDMSGSLKYKGTEIVAISGICPQKRPDISYQSAGQKVTWVLMATTITDK